jgi:phosphocarrier protein HPr
MPEHIRQITIQNELGLHARAASKLVQLAAKFPVDLQIGHDDMTVNPKSIMGVLMLAAAKGTLLTVKANGDEQACTDALNAITALFDNRFGEPK